MAVGSNQGANVVFNFGGGNTLTLNNVSLGNLNPQDFLFV
jgi:hypothetical protein